MKRLISLVGISIILIFVIGNSQTIESFEEQNNGEKAGIFDPSRFSINHSLSFGMSSSSNHSGLKSQSLYSTMMTYQFSKPITLNLNFSLPIHSTYASEHNITTKNIESLDYFKSMPFDASLIWQPSENFSMRLSIERNTTANYYYNPFLPLHNNPIKK